MSIIAEALKKAQSRGRKKVEEPPPFDLKKEQPPQAPPQAAPGAEIRSPATKAPAPRAKRITRPGAAHRPRPAAAAPAIRLGARPTPGVAKPRRWSIFIPVGVMVVLVSLVGVIYYLTRGYPPEIQSTAIEIPSPGPAPAAREMSESDEAELGGSPADEITPPADQQEGPQAKPSSVPGRAVRYRERPEMAKVPAESPVTPVPRVTATPGPEEQPPIELVQEEPVEESLEQETSFVFPAEESPPGALETIILPEEEGLGELKVDLESPPVIVQKDRDTDKPLREDIYHFNMAVFFQRQGDIPSALKEYDKVLELSPYNAEVYSNMGVLYNQIGQYEKAVAMLQKALLIDPVYSKAHNNIALAYYKSGQLDQALEHLNRAIRLEPINLESYNNLGLVYKKSDDYQKAEEAFAKALSIDPDHAPSNYNMALLCEENGQFDRAVEHYRAFIRGKGVTPELAQKVNQRLARLTRTEPAR